MVMALGTAAVTLAAIWPRTTQAEEVQDWERQGEFDEEGRRFGNIVIKGELVADRQAPGGWALVRTMENKGDTAESCVVEERVMREQVAPQARVEARSEALILRRQVIKLAPHEKRRIGVRLAPALGEQMSKARSDKASIEQAQAAAGDNYGHPSFGRTYAVFYVEYLMPLPPGAVASTFHAGRLGVGAALEDRRGLPLPGPGGQDPVASSLAPPHFPSMAEVLQEVGDPQPGQ